MTSLPPTLQSPSPLLEASWVRWANRGASVRTDITMVLEGLRVKSSYLVGLRGKIAQHRRDDLTQLATARQETWSSWEERLVRLKAWTAQAGQLSQPSEKFQAWCQTTLWLNRAQELSQHYTAALAGQVDQLEKWFEETVERMQQWSARLILEETELREFIERQAAKTTDILVSPARKRPHLDFIYLEREEEGKISVTLKSINGQISRVLGRLARAESQVSAKADINPAHFEIRKNQIIEAWKPFQQRLTQLSQRVSNHGLSFEESRLRLRWIYENVQKMKVVETTALPPSGKKKPLLQRLFNIDDD